MHPPHTHSWIKEVLEHRKDYNAEERKKCVCYSVQYIIIALCWFLFNLWSSSLWRGISGEKCSVADKKRGDGGATNGQTTIMTRQQHSPNNSTCTETHPKEQLLGMSSVLYPPLFSEIPFINICVFASLSQRRHSPTSYNEINCDNIFLSSIRNVFLVIIYSRSLLEQFYDFIVRSKINCEIIYSSGGGWHDASCILVYFVSLAKIVGVEFLNKCTLSYIYREFDLYGDKKREHKNCMPANCNFALKRRQKVEHKLWKWNNNVILHGFGLS